MSRRSQNSNPKLKPVPFMVPASQDSAFHYTLLFVRVAHYEDYEFVRSELESHIKSAFPEQENGEAQHGARYLMRYDGTKPWGRNSVLLLGEKIVRFHEQLFAAMQRRLDPLILAGKVDIGSYRQPHVDVKGNFDSSLLKELSLLEWTGLEPYISKLPRKQVDPPM